MLQRFTKNALWAMLILIAAVTKSYGAETDIAPRFAGYERGCVIQEASLGAKLVYWANPDDHGQLASIQSLPTAWRSLVGTPTVTDQTDHWMVKVPLNGVRLRSVRVIQLNRWYGKSNGISGWSLLLAAPLDDVRKIIDEKKFTLDQDGNFGPKLSADKTGKNTELICDTSM